MGAVSMLDKESPQCYLICADGKIYDVIVPFQCALKYIKSIVYLNLVFPCRPLLYYSFWSFNEAGGWGEQTL